MPLFFFLYCFVVCIIFRFFASDFRCDGLQATIDETGEAMGILADPLAATTAKLLKNGRKDFA